MVVLGLQKNAPVVAIDGHEMVPANDELALMKAVANQPVSVAIDASGSDMQFYSEVLSKFMSHFSMFHFWFWQREVKGYYGLHMKTHSHTFSK